MTAGSRRSRQRRNQNVVPPPIRFDLIEYAFEAFVHLSVDSIKLVR